MASLAKSIDKKKSYVLVHKNAETWEPSTYCLEKNERYKNREKERGNEGERGEREEREGSEKSLPAEEEEKEENTLSKSRKATARLVLLHSAPNLEFQSHQTCNVTLMREHTPLLIFLKVF